MRVQRRALPGCAASGNVEIVGHLSKVWTVACLVLAACDSQIPIRADARPVDAIVPLPCPEGDWCNLLAAPGMQGCSSNQKCTWFMQDRDGLVCGQVGCFPDGTIGVGEPCDAPPIGQADACAAGLICVAGRCRDICGFDGSAGAGCASGFNCTVHDDVFVIDPHRDDPFAGVCDPGCDPVTQLTPKGEPCPAGEGCYLLTSAVDTIAVCAGAGTVAAGETIVGTVFANSCVPGAAPRRRDPDSMGVECGGLCRPADVTSTMNQESEAGVAPDDCTTRWGAAPPDDPLAGESCRYWWARERFDGLSPFSNRVGWCFKHSIFRYDSNGDNVDDRAHPRCVDLTTGDVVPPIGNPPHNDAQSFWCVIKPPLFARPDTPADLRLDRVR